MTGKTFRATKFDSLDAVKRFINNSLLERKFGIYILEEIDEQKRF